MEKGEKKFNEFSRNFIESVYVFGRRKYSFLSRSNIQMNEIDWFIIIYKSSATYYMVGQYLYQSKK